MHAPPIGLSSVPFLDVPPLPAGTQSPAQSPRLANRILRALPGDEFAKIDECLDQVRLTQGQVLHESGERLAYAYLPTTSVVSLLFPMSSGASPEVAVVGNEGIVGVSLVMDTESLHCQAVAQSSGVALRIRAADLRRLFSELPKLRSLLMRYTQLLFMQASQTAICSGRHTIEQSLSRWLLCKHDRMTSDEIQVTHEWVASLMGVRREGVSIAAERLQAAGIIHCGRGRMTILNRAALEGRSCECYRLMRDEYTRLFKS